MKITLLGDSIRQQYFPKVTELLGDAFEVWTPDDNCRFSKYTLRCLFDWAPYMEGTDIVHWNCGHWDLCDLWGDGTFASEEEYVANMMRILDILQKKYKTIIFATTTPVRSTNKYNKNEDVERFNNLIVPKFREKGVIINDIGSILRKDIDRYIGEDTIHLTDEGIDICANEVTNYIKKAAENICNNSCENKKYSQEDDFDKVGAPILI